MTGKEIGHYLTLIEQITDEIQSFIDDKQERHVMTEKNIPSNGQEPVTKIINREQYLEFGIQKAIEELDKLYCEISENVESN